MYRRGSDGAPEFVEAPAPTDEALQAVLHKIITRALKLLTHRRALVEEEGSASVLHRRACDPGAKEKGPLSGQASVLT